jgi:shikimate dehydrogenase
MPHKRNAFGHCATASERATLLGVVNVLHRNADGTWHGDMLDGLAVVKAQTDHELSPRGAGAPARRRWRGQRDCGRAAGRRCARVGRARVDEARAADLVTLLSGYADARITIGPPRPERLRHGLQRDPWAWPRNTRPCWTPVCSRRRCSSAT